MIYTDDFLSAQRLIADAEADKLITATFSDAEQRKSFYSWLSSVNTNKDIPLVPEPYCSYAFIKQAGQLPVWADTRLMNEGAAFFARHAQAVMNLLGLLSLPYCYAAANGAMVLYLSDRIRADIGRRLTETAGFVWDVMAPGAFTPEGNGFAACLKIRFTHTLARYYTLQGGKWNPEWGTPVNQEDMAGTNLAFSLIVIRGLRKLGYTIAYKEQQAFMHLWNVIGYLLGLNENLLPPDGKAANQLEETIRLRQFKASEQGAALTQSLLSYFSGVSAAAGITGKDVTGLMRFLLGEDVADLLALPQVTLPALQLKLLQSMYLINELRAPADAALAYHEVRRQFVKNQTALQSK